MPANPLQIPRLLAISDPGAVPGPAWQGWCRELARAGVDGLQVRQQVSSDLALLALADGAREAFPAPGRLFVNRRPDIAMVARADGVQLPAAGLPIAEVRTAFASGLLVGRSTHSIEEVRRARDEGADFVLFGPVFETPSKAGRLAARGVAALAAAAGCGLPVLALGGIDGSNADRLAGAGAWGLAAIRWFREPAAVRPQLAALRRVWGQA